MSALNSTYLIQRGKFSKRDHRKGIDSIIEFDYMGAAEFEFGALGKSLKIIRENKENFLCKDYTVNDVTVTVYATEEQHELMQNWLEKTRKGDTRTKGFISFRKSHFARKKEEENFWWSIDSHFMFWYTNQNHKDLFLRKI